MQTITLYLHDNGLLDCHYLAAEGAMTVSFDPAQTPDKLKALMPAALKAALAKASAAEDRATAAEAKEAEAVAAVEAAAPLIAAQAQLEAKDAVIQGLLARNAELEIAKGFIVIEGKPAILAAPTVATDAAGSITVTGPGVITGETFTGNTVSFVN